MQGTTFGNLTNVKKLQTITDAGRQKNAATT